MKSPRAGIDGMRLPRQREVSKGDQGVYNYFLINHILPPFQKPLAITVAGQRRPVPTEWALTR